MKPQAYQKPTIYNSDGTKAQIGTYDIRTDPLTNSKADGILDYINNNLEALNAKAGNYLSLSGGTMTGSIRYVNNGKVFMIGNTGLGDNVNIGWNYNNRDGAGIGLRSTDYASNPGEFVLFARDAHNTCTLTGKPGGSLTWNNKEIATTEFVNAKDTTLESTMKSYADSAIKNASNKIESGIATVDGVPAKNGSVNGATTTHVTYSKPHVNTPIVTISLNNTPPAWHQAQPVVMNLTKTGFDIYVINKSSDTVGTLKYNWIAAEP